jgi:inosine-uridine nucleoside N-ribohydrolase
MAALSACVSDVMAMNRRKFIKSSVGAALATGINPACRSAISITSQPVILATDIGDDIDDTWALGFLLKCPELLLKLVATEYGKANYRAKLVAKFLESTGHAHVPIAVCPDKEPRGDGPIGDWVRDYNLKSYSGRVHDDGVGAIVETIMNSPQPVTVICIGPMPNIAAALEREQGIAQRARFVGMDGSIRLGYGGANAQCAEWNVKADPQAAKKGLSAPWDITITPLDTCGLVYLDGERYQRIAHSSDRVAATILENYKIWSKASKSEAQAKTRSSVLFDTVAVYLAVSQNYCEMERLGVRVMDDGFTVIDPQAKQMNVAMRWRDLDGFRDFLVNRLTGA